MINSDVLNLINTTDHLDENVVLIQGSKVMSMSYFSGNYRLLSYKIRRHLR